MTILQALAYVWLRSVEAECDTSTSQVRSFRGTIGSASASQLLHIKHVVTVSTTLGGGSRGRQHRS
ncbi:hypothetical protein EAE96_011245 [Botrytis aclada]|nr:hypothetical protein EAE96_011245 [Botrytis aclada]